MSETHWFNRDQEIARRELSDTITYKGVRLSEVPGMAAQISALQQEIARLTVDLRKKTASLQDCATSNNSAIDLAVKMEIEIARLTAERKTFEDAANMLGEIAAGLREKCDTLKREKAALRQALEPFANCERRWMAGGPAQEIRMDWLTAAREALDSGIKEKG